MKKTEAESVDEEAHGAAVGLPLPCIRDRGAVGFGRLRLFNNLQRVVSLILCGVIITLNIACTVTVTPPVNPTKPTVVYFCDYGVHSSLLLPVSPGRYVEYLYGDWNWAALCHNSWLDALGAIFWSGQATLGRRFIDQPANQTMPLPPDGPKTEVPIVVNGDGCAAVLKRMGDRWERDRVATTGPSQIVSDFWYVKDDQHYYWLHDCNLDTADSLAEMGCTVRGYAVWSGFSVQSAGGTPVKSKDLVTNVGER